MAGDLLCTTTWFCQLFLSQVQKVLTDIAKALDMLHSIPFPAQRGWVRVSTSGAAVGIGWRWRLGSTFPCSSLPYLEYSSWLRTVGRKKRDLRGEKSHITVTSEAKQENTTG